MLMVDKAICNRLDLSISLELPEKEQIEKFINLVLKEDQFGFDKKVSFTECEKVPKDCPMTGVLQVANPYLFIRPIEYQS